MPNTPREFSTVEACVDAVIATLGKDIRLGAPLGLGKPNQLINAFFRRAKDDPSLSLAIYTALSYLQVADGVWYADGGVYSIVQSLGDLATPLTPKHIELLKAFTQIGAPPDKVGAQVFKKGRNLIELITPAFAQIQEINDFCPKIFFRLPQLVTTTNSRFLKF